MKTVQVRLPDSVHGQLKKLAKQEGVSLNQLLVAAASNEVVRQETREFFRQTATEHNAGAFAAALAAVSDIPQLLGDEI